MKYTPIVERSMKGGWQKLYHFPNNRGASVVRHEFSYGGDRGLWELAVIKYTDDGKNLILDYSTPITEDVEGYLTEADVEKLLNQIESLT